MGGVTCPCCGQDVEPSRLLVSPETRTAQFSGKRVKLANKQLRLVGALNNRYPRVVSVGDLVGEVWGYDEPEHAEKALHVQACLARRKMEQIGVAIVNVPCVGYRLQMGPS